MHEISIAQSILDVAAASLKDNAVRSVVAVSLRIGPISGVDPDALRFAMEVVAQGTPLEGADLRIETPPVRFRCTDCNHEFEAGEVQFSCPSCGGTRIKLISGDELEIVNLEVETT
jgi:hydrogenase nickel incorporation protein HypA/HybF